MVVSRGRSNPLPLRLPFPQLPRRCISESFASARNGMAVYQRFPSSSKVAIKENCLRSALLSLPSHERLPKLTVTPNTAKAPPIIRWRILVRVSQAAKHHRQSNILNDVSYVLPTHSQDSRPVSKTLESVSGCWIVGYRHGDGLIFPSQTARFP